MATISQFKNGSTTYYIKDNSGTQSNHIHTSYGASLSIGTTSTTTIPLSLLNSSGTTLSTVNLPISAGPKGDKGDTGAAAGFDTPAASASSLAPTATATASVTASGSDTKKKFTFTFGIPKGEKGDTGSQGPAGPAGPVGDHIKTATVTTGASARTLSLIQYTSETSTTSTINFSYQFGTAAPTSLSNGEIFFVYSTT